MRGRVHRSSQNIFLSCCVENEALIRLPSNDPLSHYTTARYV
jgi:hypothetical protein